MKRRSRSEEEVKKHGRLLSDYEEYLLAIPGFVPKSQSVVDGTFENIQDAMYIFELTPHNRGWMYFPPGLLEEALPIIIFQVLSRIYSLEIFMFEREKGVEVGVIGIRLKRPIVLSDLSSSKWIQDPCKYSNVAHFGEIALDSFAQINSFLSPETPAPKPSIVKKVTARFVGDKTSSSEKPSAYHRNEFGEVVWDVVTSSQAIEYLRRYYDKEWIDRLSRTSEFDLDNRFLDFTLYQAVGSRLGIYGGNSELLRNIGLEVDKTAIRIASDFWCEVRGSKPLDFPLPTTLEEAAKYCLEALDAGSRDSLVWLSGQSFFCLDSVYSSDRSVCRYWAARMEKELKLAENSELFLSVGEESVDAAIWRILERSAEICGEENK
jgi:hypothetical protein